MTVGLHRLRVPTAVTVGGEPPLQIAVSLYVPQALAQPALVLCCVPGGGMNRGYYDLVTAEGDTRASLAHQMAARGFIVMTLDSPGLGESDKPADCYLLSPALIAQALGEAMDAVLAQLREGHAVPGLAALPALRSVGLGHSMGGLLTILSQAQRARHAALIVLGFATAGLPQFMTTSAKALIGDRAAIDAQLEALSRKMFGNVQYPRPMKAANGAELYGSSTTEPDVVAALKPCVEGILPQPAQLSLFPGNVAAEAATIDVPVYIGVGDKDMTGKADDIPLAFTASPAVHLQVLPQTGHSHFLFPSRTALFDGIARWLADVLQRSVPA